jgi:hypothetical protein
MRDALLKQGIGGETYAYYSRVLSKFTHLPEFDEDESTFHYFIPPQYATQSALTAEEISVVGNIVSMKRKASCMHPSTVHYYNQLLKKLTKLPGFDSAKSVFQYSIK